jgi:hypothetical protein
MPPNEHDKDKTIHFTIDGQPVTIDEPKQTAAALLRLVGLDPADYDLAEIRKGHADPKRYEDNETVHVKNDDAFVTIRERAEVA